MANPLERVGLPLRHLSLGLLIRELLAPWTGHPYDFEIWVRLGYYMQTLTNPYRTLPYVPGLSASPYDPIGSISYPPFSAFIFGLTYKIYNLLGGPSRFLYYFLLKQPMILADVGVAIILASIIRRSGDNRSAKSAFLIWLYFPLGIIISSVWGQLDPISLLLSLLAVYYFLSTKWLPSAATLGLAIYLKTLPVVFLPVFLLRAQTSTKNKMLYSLVSLIIPILGTLLPVWALGWGFRGAYNNISYQVAIPSTGAMSLLGQVHQVPSLLFIVNPLTTGIVWVPVLLATYAYTFKKNVPLVPALVLAILAFSISRPSLSEQWSLYPLALLLLTTSKENIEHFTGLAIASIAFLIANNTLLVRFLTPIYPQAFTWDVFINNQSSYVALRTILMAVMALLYFMESLLVIVGRRSILYRVVPSALPDWFLQKFRVSSPEVRVR